LLRRIALNILWHTFYSMKNSSKRGFLNNQTKSRRRFRIVLLILLGISLIFCAGMITLRVNKKAHWYVVNNYQNEIFTADVYGHHLRAAFQNDDQRYITASTLIHKAFFSPIYGKAGVLMLKDLADGGHAASQMKYADMMMLSSHTVPDYLAQAKYYYGLAAAQNYLPAVHKLASME
jgi:hypothetical protein